MNTRLTLLAFISVLALTSFNAKATVTLTADSDIKVKVVEAMTFTHDAADHLNFGTIMSMVGHTVSLGMDGTRTSTDNGQLITDGNTPSLDKFKITSPEARSISLSIATPAKVGEAGLVPTLHTNPGLVDGKISLIKGENNFDVYGELAVTKDAATGDFTEPYTITVTY